MTLYLVCLRVSLASARLLFALLLAFVFWFLEWENLKNVGKDYIS